MFCYTRSTTKASKQAAFGAPHDLSYTPETASTWSENKWSASIFIILAMGKLTACIKNDGSSTKEAKKGYVRVSHALSSKCHERST